MKLKLLITLGIVIFSLNISAQTNDNSHEKELTNHEHHRNEIGIANAPVYFVKEEAFAYGLHIHYMRSIKQSKVGIGLGYERVFDEHGHNSLGFIIAYTPIESLSFSVSPGMVIEDGNSDLNFALHLETAYEFELKNFHIGPLLEFAIDPEDIHISLGLHLGYGF